MADPAAMPDGNGAMVGPGDLVRAVFRVAKGILGAILWPLARISGQVGRPTEIIPT